MFFFFFFFFSSRRRHTRYWRDWSSDVCSSDLTPRAPGVSRDAGTAMVTGRSCRPVRSEEHTSELQSRQYLVCRLLLEKKIRVTPYGVSIYQLLFASSSSGVNHFGSTSLPHLNLCMRWRDSATLYSFFKDSETTEIYTLSLHDALPI